MALLSDTTQRSQQEESLRESQARLHLALGAVGVGAWIADTATQTVTWDHHLAQILGLSDGKIAGTYADLLACIHADDRPLVRQTLDRVLPPDAFEIDFRCLHPDGKIRQIRARACVLKNESAEPARIAGVCFDITDRQQDDEQLRLRSMALDAAANAILIIDRKGCIQWANHAACELSGYTHGEMLGQNPRIFRSGKHSVATYRQLWNTILSGQIWRGELINRHKSGKLVHEEISITPVPDQRGEVTYFVEIRQDVTRRKNDERALRHRQRELEQALADLELSRSREQRLLATIPSICVGISEDNMVTHWNPTAEKVLGISAAEAVGKPLFSLPLRWERKEIEDGIARCRGGDGAVRLRDIRLPDARGRNRILGLTLNRIELHAGKADGVVIVGADVTDRRHLESQNVLAQKMESLGALAAGIAHEINTPTQYVGDNTRFLRDSFGKLRDVLDQSGKLLEEAENGAVSPASVASVRAAVDQADLDYLLEETPKAIDETLEGLERVARIVRAMKDFSHPDHEERAPADLNQAIESTVTVSRHEWKYVADIELDLDPSLPPVPCLVGGINQVVLNLIVNAAHAIADALGENSDRKGKIRISTRRDGPQVEIRVTDSGTGIPDSIRARIFDPFFTTKEVGKGTGQGLALAHNIVVEKHGGRIDVETEVGSGSTFLISLPLEKRSQRAVDNGAKALSPAACGERQEQAPPPERDRS